MASLSPAMRVSIGRQERHPDTLLFFRMGDFDELVQDAIVAARDLNSPSPPWTRPGAAPRWRSATTRRRNDLQRLLRKGFPRRHLRTDGGPKTGQGCCQTRGYPRPHLAPRSTPPSEPSKAITSPASPSPCQAPRPSAESRYSTSPTGEFRTTEFRGRTQRRQQMADELGPRTSGRATLRNRPARLGVNLAGEAEEDTAVFDAIAPERPSTNGSSPPSTPFPCLRNHTQAPLARWRRPPAGHETAAIAAGASVHLHEGHAPRRPRARRRSSLLRTFFLSRTRRCQRAQSRARRYLLFSGDHPRHLLHTLDAVLHPDGKRLLRATSSARLTTSPRSKLVSMPSPKPSPISSSRGRPPRHGRPTRSRTPAGTHRSRSAGPREVAHSAQPSPASP